MTSTVGPLRCEGLVKSFDGVLALDHVDVAFPASGIVAIIGPNGAGKTTLFNAINGLVRVDGGRVMFQQFDIRKREPTAIARLGVGRTFQDLRIIQRLSVLENVLLAIPRQRGEKFLCALSGMGVGDDESRNTRLAMEVLESVGLGGLGGELAGELSYGQQKLLTLACCIATEAQVMLLDEPFSGVFPEIAAKILEVLAGLREKRKLVVFIEHDLGSVRLAADLVVVMDDGRIIATGPPEDVLRRQEIMDAYIE